MSFEQRNEYFCKAQTDVQMAYIEAEREVKQLKAENAKLRELVRAMKPFLCCMPFASCNTLAANVRSRMREIGIEVEG